MTGDQPLVIELTGFDQVREAYRIKDLRQAMYTEGGVVMADCLLDLHGDDHRQRRRLENRLFRRETFAHWERDVLGRTIELTLGPFVAAGRGDLVDIGYRAAMNLTAMIAGIDHDPTDAEATDALYATVRKFSEGATLVHSTRDKEEVRAEVRAIMATFEATLLAPSIERRRAILDAGEDGPPDVLTTLLANEDRLPLPHDVLVREICFYLQAGAHSTANAFTHTIDQIFTWAADDPSRLERARGDMDLVQRCMHESLRLNPASPVAWRTPLGDAVMSDGTELPTGCRVVLDLMAANRDESVFGPDAERFDPDRIVPDGVAPWGHSFGGGTHACIGAELDGGLEPGRSDDHLYGTVAVVAHRFLAAGGRPDPGNPAVLDPTIERTHYSSYPVVFA